MSQYTYGSMNVSEGKCEISIPQKLSHDSVTDIKDWFALIVRQISRRAHVYSEFLPEVPWRNDDFIPEVTWNYSGK